MQHFLSTDLKNKLINMVFLVICSIGALKNYHIVIIIIIIITIIAAYDT